MSCNFVFTYLKFIEIDLRFKKNLLFFLWKIGMNLLQFFQFIIYVNKRANFSETTNLTKQGKPVLLTCLNIVPSNMTDWCIVLYFSCLWYCQAEDLKSLHHRKKLLKPDTFDWYFHIKLQKKKKIINIKKLQVGAYDRCLSKLWILMHQAFLMLTKIILNQAVIMKKVKFIKIRKQISKIKLDILSSL